MTALRTRITCFRHGHDATPIARGYLLTFLRCDRCGRTFMAHRHYGNRLLPWDGVLPDMPWLERVDTP